MFIRGLVIFSFHLELPLLVPLTTHSPYYHHDVYSSSKSPPPTTAYRHRNCQWTCSWPQYHPHMYTGTTLHLGSVLYTYTPCYHPHVPSSCASSFSSTAYRCRKLLVSLQLVQYHHNVYSGPSCKRVNSYHQYFSKL